MRRSGSTMEPSASGRLPTWSRPSGPAVWTLGGVLDDEQFARLREEARIALRPFVANDGTLLFDMPALIVTARKAP
jgi:hypothetical protein